MTNTQIKYPISVFLTTVYRPNQDGEMIRDQSLVNIAVTNANSMIAKRYLDNREPAGVITTYDSLLPPLGVARAILYGIKQKGLEVKSNNFIELSNLPKEDTLKLVGKLAEASKRDSHYF